MKSKYIFALKNYRAALIAALFFGCIAPGAKFLAKDIPPQSMAGLLYLFAGVGLFVILLLRKNILQNFARVQKNDIRWFALATLFGGILGPAFLTYGISHIRGSTASLLLNMEAVFTSTIAWFIFKEHFEKKIVYGMILILLGCIALSVNTKVAGGADTFLGFVLISLACLSWGIDNNVTRNISHLNPVLTACFKGLIAGSSNLFLGYLIGEKLVLNVQIFQIGLLGFLGIGISLVAFIVSLGSIGTARTGAIFSTAPFIGSAISIIFLSESLTIPFAIALVFMACGMWFHLSENHDHEHTHLPFEHTHEHIHDEHHQHIHSEEDSLSKSHTHPHKHEKLTHKHSHFPDIHHQHTH